MTIKITCDPQFHGKCLFSFENRINVKNLSFHKERFSVPLPNIILDENDIDQLIEFLQEAKESFKST